MKQSIFTTFLRDSEDDSDFDLPSPTLFARSGMSTPDLLMPQDKSTRPSHFRDPSFSLDSSELYITKQSPAHPTKPNYSPKFSGSSVFDSRAINPLSLTPPRRPQEQSTPRRARMGTSGSRLRIKVEKLLPDLAQLRRRMDVGLSQRTEVRARLGVNAQKPQQLRLPGLGEQSDTQKHWTLTSSRRLPLKRTLGYLPKPHPPTERSSVTTRKLGRFPGRKVCLHKAE